MVTVTADFIKPYISEGKRHSNYPEAKKQYLDFKVHSDGDCPGDLLLERRPGESEHIFNYRKKIYQPKTKTAVMKVLNVLGKIRRSSDWSIKYDEKVPARIPVEDSLQNYCEYNYPKYGSLTKWLFDVALKQHCIDANAVILIHHGNTEPNEFPKPTAMIFNSDRVIDFVPGQYAVLLSEERNEYVDGKKYYDGEIYYIPTIESTFVLKQQSSTKDKWTVEEFKHKAGQLPAFIVGGLVKNGSMHESRLSGMVPSLNAAVTIYSDKQAELVQHVHSEKWIYQTQQCSDCSGQGRIPKANASPIECAKCKGMGVVNTSPYSNLIINPNNLPLGEKQVPIPPAGYIQKTDVAAMVAAISAEIKQEMWDAYSSVNMEFLMEAPMAESGLSKEVDRDELNNFVYGVAEDLVATLDRCYQIICYMRYGYLIKDNATLKSMCPKIAVPEKYDLLSGSYYMERIKSAREAKVNPLIVSMMEIEYATKAMYNNPEVADILAAVNKLNPLPSVTEEDKMVMKSNGGISEKDYIISCNIVSFIQRAAEEDEQFFKQPISSQKKIISGYADEVIKANSSNKVSLGYPVDGN